MQEGYYVYCIIGTGEARNFGPIGIGGRGDTVTTIAYRDLGAAVTIEVVMRDYAVLPVRFYTVAPNAEEVRSLLRKRYHEFKKLLRDLDNKVEMGLKAFWKDVSAVFSEVVGNNDAMKAARDKLIAGPDEEDGQDTGILGKIVRLALQDEQAKAAEALLQPLRQLSSDISLSKVNGTIVNAAFLVDRTREKDFDNEVDTLAAKYGRGIRFKYVGPAPPYSFVNMVVKE